MYKNAVTSAGKTSAVGRKRSRFNSKTHSSGPAGPCVSLITGKVVHVAPNGQIQFDLAVPSARLQAEREANRLLAVGRPHVKEEIDVPWDKDAPSYYPPSTYVAPGTLPTALPVAAPASRQGTGKVSRSGGRLAQRSFKIPSPDEVAACATPAGGWKAMQMAEWGIAWPPTQGWRAYLTAIWHQEGARLHDTVFDIAFRDQWQALPSDARVPLLRVRPIP